jgi:ABC-type nickel/cobalt efflux system permease component RcnA
MQIDRRLALSVLALACLWAGAEHAVAQGAGPFGVGMPETGGAVAANGLFGWIATEQSKFYRALTGALRAFRTDPAAGWTLAGLAFAYGVLHAAGPGHGKAVITSYVLANRETVKRAILLAFLSAVLQALVAVAMVGTGTLLLNLTSVAMTTAALGLEIASGAMITALGIWLVWTKIFVAGQPHAEHVHTPDCDHQSASGAGGTQRMRFGAPSASAPSASIQATDAFACEICAHVAQPAALQGPLSLRKALSAVMAVGIRPCTGAIIVLVFAFSQGRYLAGMAAVLAMAVGTAITVASLATFAVAARNAAVRMAGADSRWGHRLTRGAEIAAAVLILSMGMMILGATLVGNAVAQ